MNTNSLGHWLVGLVLSLVAAGQAVVAETAKQAPPVCLVPGDFRMWTPLTQAQLILKANGQTGYRFAVRYNDCHDKLAACWKGRKESGPVGAAEIKGATSPKPGLVMLQVAVGCLFGGHAWELKEYQAALEGYLGLCKEEAVPVVLLADGGWAGINPATWKPAEPGKPARWKTQEEFAAYREKETIGHLKKWIALAKEKKVTVIPSFLTFYRLYEKHPELTDLHGTIPWNDCGHLAPREAYVIACTVALALSKQELTRWPTGTELFAEANAKTEKANANARKAGKPEQPLLVLTPDEQTAIQESAQAALKEWNAAISR